MPEFAKLIEKQFSLNQRYAVVVEQLALWNDPAKGGVEMMKTSYQKIQKAMRLGKIDEYHLPGYQNPLRSTYDPDSRGNKLSE